MEIWVNDSATITASEVKLGTGGPIISYDTETEDRFSPIISSNCVVPLVIENTTQEQFVTKLRETYNERDVYIHLYRATEAEHSSVKPLWSGFVLMDLSSTPDEYYPYDVKLTAVDGLSLLKDIDFVETTTRRAGTYIQADMYYGPATYVFWIREILAKSGASTTTEGVSEDYVFTTAINWFESQMPTITQSTDPFAQTKCAVSMFHTKTDNDVFEVSNCYDVLKELLRHWGARMTYWKGQYWIVQIPEYNTNDAGTYINPDNINTRTYSKTGAFVSSSDNLGDSYWTRYQLYIDNISGGIQKLTGTEINYLPQLREAIAQNISFGGGNRYGGFPTQFNGSDAQTQVVFQDDINDASDSDAIDLYIPLDVTITKSWSFELKIKFNFYCTNGSNIYYLQYDPTLTFPYYWVISTQWTTLVKAPTWNSGLYSSSSYNPNGQSHTINGFEEQIPFKLYNTSTQAFSDIDLSGNYQFYLDIDNYGTNAGNPGSFLLRNASAGLSTTFYYNPIHVHVNTTWTNTLKTGASLSFTNNSASNTSGTNNIIQFTSPNYDPFEGMLVVVTNSTGSIYGNSYVSSVNTSDVEIVDFGTLIWGDALQASDKGSLKVFDGSTFEKSAAAGNWGKGILTGTDSFTQILLDEYLKGQVKVIESPSMRLVTSALNRESSDGSGLRPNYVNPIGRLRENKVNLTDVQYIFKRGAFYTLTDEWDYEGYEIRLDSLTITKTVNPITGPNNPIPVAGSVAKISNFSNAFGQIISKQIITSTSSSVAAGAITSLPIALINEVVFKVGDYFNVLNSDTNEFIKFELNAQQFSDSSALTVVSKTITDNIPANSIITFNAFDLTSQYQNKTRGTVAGFDITATGIEKSSINITDWLNSDTMSGAAVTNVPTALSVKNYVDGQVGASDTLQEVTDNGNTTTNSITIGNAASPNNALEVYGNADTGVARFRHTSNGAYGSILLGSVNRLIGDVGTYMFKNGSSELMRLTSGGNLLLGTTTDSGEKLVVNGNAKYSGKILAGIGATAAATINSYTTTVSTNLFSALRILENTGATSYWDIGAIGGTNTLLNFYHNATTTAKISFTHLGGATFSGQVTIPATPVATTDAASKSYVDAQVGASDTLQEVTDNGNTTSQPIRLLNATNVNSKFESNTNLYLNADYDSNSGDAYRNIIFQNRGAEKMRLTSGGNLLLGTTTDNGNKLQVNGTSTFSGNVEIRSSQLNIRDTSSNAQIKIQGSVGGTARIMAHDTNTGNDQGLLVVAEQVDFTTGSISGSANSRALLLDSLRNANFSGNVGIGLANNTNPTEKLHVVGDALITGDSHADAFKPAATGEPIKFKNFASTEVGRFTDGGNLLLGTSTDSGDKLNINGSIAVSDISFNTDSVSVLVADETIGAEEITNGDFATDSGWVKGTGWTISGGKANANTTGNFITLYQNSVLTIGKTYKSSFTLTSHTQGAIRLTQSGHNISGEKNILGTYVNYFTATHTTIDMQGMSSFIGSIDNVSVKEVTSASNQIQKREVGTGAFGPTPVGAYLLLTGGTLTGSLTGTSATFTGLVNINKQNEALVINAVSDGGSYINFKNNSLGGYGYLGAANQLVSGGSNTALALRTQTDLLFSIGVNEKMRLSISGNLLIGTTTDSAKLTVDETTTNNLTVAHFKHNQGAVISDIILENSAGANNTGFNINFKLASSGAAAKIGAIRTNSPGAGDTDMVFSTSTNGGSVNEAMRITHDSNVLIGSTSDNGQQLQVTGNIRITGGFQASNTGGFLLADTGGSMRYGLKFGAAGAVGATNLMMLTNRSLSSATGGGEVAIAANASTTGVTETEVMRIKANTQSQVSIDGVLSLTSQNTPADPPNRASTIWLDSNFDLKIKITNNSGVTVTKTIVEYA